MAVSLGLAAALVGSGLGIGLLGYHFIARLEWTDAFLEASMIATGMGPVATMSTNPAKIFAACYALLSGFVFLTALTFLLAPVMHRVLHKFHVGDN